MWKVEVDEDKCTACEECVGSCPAGVLELIDREGKDKEKNKKKSKQKSDPVNIDECLGCETCVEVCPEDAIEVSED